MTNKPKKITKRAPVAAARAAAPVKSVAHQRSPRLPWLHKKRYYIPLYIVAGLMIVFLLSLPLLPQAQSVGQDVTKSHPVVAKIAPKNFRPPNVDLPTSGNWLVIPKAGIKMPIIEGDSISVLNKQVGVWHQTGDIKHNYVIAGHRLQYHRTVNQSLYHLDRMQVGDTGIYVVIDGKARQYKATETKVVDKHSVEILNPTANPELTIYTCNDFFNQRRLTVVAVPA